MPFHVHPADAPLFEAVLTRSVHDAASMAESLEQHSLQPVAELAHRIVGALGAFGLTQVAAAAGALERACRHGDHAQARQCLDELEGLLRETRASMGPNENPVP